MLSADSSYWTDALDGGMEAWKDGHRKQEEKCDTWVKCFEIMDSQSPHWRLKENELIIISTEPTEGWINIQ